MSRRSGFSLVEMVIVMALAGLVASGAIAMFDTQNRLGTAVTSLGESQENARSAVEFTASELRGVTGGAVVRAEPHRLVVRLPIIVGMICGQQSQSFSAVYFPLGGQILNLQTDVDGYDVRSPSGTWSTDTRIMRPDGFRGSGSRQPCTAAGNAQAGSESDYATLHMGGASAGIGSPVRLFREITYHFGTSGLDAGRRAFFRSRAGVGVELAQGFSADSRFEYRLLSDTQWRASVTSADLGRIAAIRLLVEAVGEGSRGSSRRSASFALVREITLRNAR